MSYKRYIVINGKRYGPYEYKSYRDKDGKVKSVRIKKNKAKKKPSSKISLEKIKKHTQTSALVLLLIFIVFFLVFMQNKLPVDITGQASLSFSKNTFITNEKLQGQISLTLQRGEFLPSETLVVLESENFRQELPLNGFVELSGDSEIIKSQENFYTTNIYLDGFGEGYGFLGQKEILNETTNETYFEDGFGEDYLLEEAETLEIPLENFNFQFNSTGIKEFNLTIKYNGTIIYSEIGKINIEEESLFEKALSEELKIPGPQKSQEDFLGEEENKTQEVNESEELNETLEINESLGITEIDLGVEEEPEKIQESEEEIPPEEIIKEEIPGEEEKPEVTQESTVQYQAVIGQPVKWVKKIKLNKSISNISIELPPNIENITIHKIKQGKKEEVDINNVKVSEKGKEFPLAQTDLITGYSILDNYGETKISDEENFFSKILNWLNSFSKGITGFVAYQIQEDSTKIIIEEELEEIEIEYYTEAPQVIEKKINKFRKEITVYSDVHYENILAYTTINEVPKKTIKLYRTTGKIKELIQITNYLDENNNDLIDKIEWIVPSLSSETYEVEITILNVQSYPMVGGYWGVYFDTVGKADLTIQSVDGTTWDDKSEDPSLYDLKFIEVRCGETLIEHQWKNGKVFIKNYYCDKTGKEKSKVLTSGKHTLKFTFGSETAYAYNEAGDGDGWTTQHLSETQDLMIKSNSNQRKLILYGGPVNYYNETGYVPINSTVVSSSDPLYDYEVVKGLYKVYYKTNPTIAQHTKFIKEGSWVTYQLMSLNYRNDLDMIQQISITQEVTGIPKESEFVYPNVFGTGKNVSFTYQNNVLLKKLIIGSKSDLSPPDQYILDGGNPTLDLDLIFDYEQGTNIYICDKNHKYCYLWDKSSQKETDGYVDFRKNGKTYYYWVPPKAIDSERNKDDSLSKYVLKKTGTKLYVNIKTNYTWLNETAVFPVIIDPTIKLETKTTIIDHLEDQGTFNTTIQLNNWTEYEIDGDGDFVDNSPDTGVYKAGGGSLKGATIVTGKDRNRAWSSEYMYRNSTEIPADAIVTLNFSWRKSYANVLPAKQNMYVKIKHPNTSIITLWENNIQTWDTWTDENIDVSQYFTETGIYEVRLGCDLTNGNNADAQTMCWFDEVILLDPIEQAENVADVYSDDGLGSYEFQIKFGNLSAIPSTATVNSADLCVYTTECGGGGCIDADASFERVLDYGWEETGFDAGAWNAQSTDTVTASETWNNTESGLPFFWMCLNVTAVVEKDISGDNKNTTIRIEDIDSPAGDSTDVPDDAGLYIGSTMFDIYNIIEDRENTGFSGNTPYLVIDYTEGGDSDPPAITIDSPTNSSYNTNTIDFNVTIDETGSLCQYSLDRAANVSMTDLGSNEWGKQVTSISEGSRNVIFTCNDTSNNWNATNVSFFVDSIVPVIAYNASTPANASRQTANSVTINISVVETNLGTCLLDWQGTNETFDNNNGAELFWETKATTDGTLYEYKVWCNDTSGNGNATALQTFRENDEPSTPTLTYPTINNHTTDRAPNFTWSTSSDSDPGDSITYILTIACHSAGGCSADNREYSGISVTSKDLGDAFLLHFGDDNEYYNWTVTAYDSYEYSGNATERNLTIDSLISLSLPTQNFTEFTGLTNDDTANTTDAAYDSLVLQNDGNSYINVTIKATDMLWVTEPNPSTYYQFKINRTDEGVAYSETGTLTTWTNVPTTEIIAVNQFNWTNTTDTIGSDILVTVPSDEQADEVKTSTLLFTGYYIKVT